MASVKNIVAALAISSIAGLSAVVGAQGSAARGEQSPPKGVPTVSLIGCVERAAPPARDPADTSPAPSPAYKLIDVQAGGGSPVVGRSGGGAPPAERPPTQQPMVVEREYLLAVPAAIKLHEYQNQRVELTGTLGATPASAAASAQRGADRRPGMPGVMLTVTAVKVVSTECR